MNAPMDDVRCPLCHTEGWAASRLTAAYAATCGTVWDTDGYANQAPACQIISGLRFEVALLQMQTGAAA